MKKDLSVAIAFALLFFVAIGFYFQRPIGDSLAQFFWNKYHNERLALFFDKSDAGLAMNIGNYYFNGGAYNLEQAQRAYQRVLSLTPKATLAHYQIARINFLKGDFYNALVEINKEIEFHPEIPNSYYVRGLIEAYTSEFGGAERDFLKFIEKMPYQWAGYNDLAWVQAKSGKFQEAKNTVLEGFKRIPGTKDANPWLWISLGLAHLNLKEYNEARDAFLTALNLSNKIDAQYFWSAYPGNNPQNADKAFKQFRSTLHFNLGTVYEKLGEFKKAKSEYETYLSLLPEEDFFKSANVKNKINELNAQTR